MSDPIKLTGNVKYTPSQTQIDVKWAGAHAKKKRLLESSDWTQLKDVHPLLTPAQQLAWDGWRRQVRMTRASNFATPEEFEVALTQLTVSLPTDRSVAAPSTTRAPMSPESEVSIDITDAIHELAETASKAIARAANIVNMHTLQDRVSEALDAIMLCKTTPEDEIDAAASGKFPILTAVRSLTRETLLQAASRTIDQYQFWLSRMAVLDSLTDYALRQAAESTATAESILSWLDEQITAIVAGSTHGH